MWPAGRGNGCDGIPNIAARTSRDRAGRAMRRRPHRVGACTFAENADLSASGACATFLASVDASVLSVIASPVTAMSPRFDLGATACLVDVTMGEDGNEHILLRDHARRLRIDVVSGSLLNGPVSLRVLIERLEWADWTWDALNRLRETMRTGTLAPRPVASRDRIERWRAALACWDARRAGATQRELADMLVGPERARNEWRTGSDDLRSRVRRIVRFADHMVGGGWRALLAPPSETVRSAPSA